MVNCMLIAVAAALVNNVVLSQFLRFVSFPWSFKKNRYCCRNGSCGYFCYYDCVKQLLMELYYAILVPFNLRILTDYCIYSW